jgi:hypothetical protein
MADVLRALVFAVWSSLHAGPLPADAVPIADALVTATLQRAHEAPALGSHALDLVTLAVWAEHESRLLLLPVPESWDARGGVSCGYLQLPCAFVATHSLADQASRWLQLLRWGARACPEAPAAPLSSGSCHRGRRLAEYRIGLARETLARLLVVAEQQE